MALAELVGGWWETREVPGGLFTSSLSFTPHTPSPVSNALQKGPPSTHRPCSLASLGQNHHNSAAFRDAGGAQRAGHTVVALTSGAESHLIS